MWMYFLLLSEISHLSLLSLRRRHAPLSVFWSCDQDVLYKSPGTILSPFSLRQRVLEILVFFFKLNIFFLNFRLLLENVPLSAYPKARYRAKRIVSRHCTIAKLFHEWKSKHKVVNFRNWFLCQFSPKMYKFLHGAFLTPQELGDIFFWKIFACKGGKSKKREGGVFHS